MTRRTASTRSSLAEGEKAYSFLNRYFVMKRVGTGNAKVINKWLKLIRQPRQVEV